VDGDFDADRGLGLGGVGRSTHWSRVCGLSAFLQQIYITSPKFTSTRSDDQYARAKRVLSSTAREQIQVIDVNKGRNPIKALQSSASRSLLR
jgi:hypothetical protein